MKHLIIATTLLTLAACGDQQAAQEYLCDQDQTVTINELDNEQALLSYQDKEYTLTRQVSASGVKYSDKQRLFWVKGDQAMLIINADKLQCKLQS